MRGIPHLFLVSFVAILTQLLAVTYVSADQSCKSVRVACNVPLTGALATYGSAIQEGVRFAAESRPASTVPVTYDWEDNQSDGRQSVTILRKQLLKNPDLYVSGVKPHYMAIKDEVKKTQLPHFVWVFDVNVRPNNERNFRTWVNFKVEPPLFIEYAKAQHPKKIAIVYVQLPHTDEEYLNHIIPGLRAAGFSDLKVEPYQMDKLDFKDIALRLRAYAPDLIILSGFQENYIAMVKAFNIQRLLRAGNTVASYDFLDAAPLLSPGEIEGVRVAMPKFLLEQDNPRISKWIAAFEAKFHKKPLYTHAYAYDMADIINTAGNDLSSGCTATDWVNALSKVNKDGVTGPLKFDEQGDLVPSVTLGVFRNGIVVADKKEG